MPANIWVGSSLNHPARFASTQTACRRWVPRRRAEPGFNRAGPEEQNAKDAKALKETSALPVIPRSEATRDLLYEPRGIQATTTFDQIPRCRSG